MRYTMYKFMFTYFHTYLIFMPSCLLCSWSMSSSATGQQRRSKVEPDWSQRQHHLSTCISPVYLDIDFLMEAEATCTIVMTTATGHTFHSVTVGPIVNIVNSALLCGPL